MRRGQRRGELLQPIARWEPAVDGEVLLLDPTAMQLHFRMGPRDVRRYEPVACDRETRAPLYDQAEVAEARARMRPRRAA